MEAPEEFLEQRGEAADQDTALSLDQRRRQSVVIAASSLVSLTDLGIDDVLELVDMLDGYILHGRPVRARKPPLALASKS